MNKKVIVLAIVIFNSSLMFFSCINEKDNKLGGTQKSNVNEIGVSEKKLLLRKKKYLKNCQLLHL